ncbi:MAG: hypothetical protein FWC55_08255 [Firmicutes bacterium]|nr:hypothetical protein [Bacillota bacterium]
MGKVRKTQAARGTEILRYGLYQAAPVTVSDAGIAVINGAKVAKAGTIVGGVGGKRLADASVAVAAANGSGAEGVLLYDVDVTDGPAEGSMVVFGFVDLAKLPEAPTAAAAQALRMVQFLA